MKKPTAFVMVGAPGSGKSTYAKKLAFKEKAIIISGDDIRAELFGSAAIQGGWGEIWDEIDGAVADVAPSTLILDGTHFRKVYRAEAVMMLRSHGYERVEAVVSDCSLSVCLQRNSSRERQVPDYIIKQMHTELQDSLKDICLEDFNCVHFIY